MQIIILVLSMAESSAKSYRPYQQNAPTTKGAIDPTADHEDNKFFDKVDVPSKPPDDSLSVSVELLVMAKITAVLMLVTTV